jgi:hypothetical protein
MKNEQTDFWFPAKRYGWGWTFPITWQGWAVFVVYGLAIIACVAFFNPQQHTAEFVGSTFGLTVLLMLVCWLKGEKPRWRWGGKGLD